MNAIFFSVLLKKTNTYQMTYSTFEVRISQSCGSFKGREPKLNIKILHAEKIADNKLRCI